MGFFQIGRYSGYNVKWGGKGKIQNRFYSMINEGKQLMREIIVRMTYSALTAVLSGQIINIFLSVLLYVSDFTTSTYFYIRKKINNSGGMSNKETIKIAKTQKVKKN